MTGIGIPNTEEIVAMKSENHSINGRVFKKSSYSPPQGNPWCVLVSISEKNVLVSSTNRKEMVSEFTIEEWRAFISGVKNGEFDL